MEKSMLGLKLYFRHDFETRKTEAILADVVGKDEQKINVPIITTSAIASIKDWEANKEIGRRKAVGAAIALARLIKKVDNKHHPKLKKEIIDNVRTKMPKVWNEFVNHPYVKKEKKVEQVIVYKNGVEHTFLSEKGVPLPRRTFSVV
jgi:hypothetical protein